MSTPKTKAIYIRVPTALHDELKARAARDGRPLAEVVAVTLAHGLGWSAEYKVIAERLVIAPPDQPVPEAFRLGAEVRRLGLAR